MVKSREITYFIYYEHILDALIILTISAPGSFNYSIGHGLRFLFEQFFKMFNLRKYTYHVGTSFT